jgi:uncharacterized membrane protein
MKVWSVNVANLFISWRAIHLFVFIKRFMVKMVVIIYFFKGMDKEMGLTKAHSEINKQMNQRNIWAGILFGVGLVTFIDEVVFHQFLHWHHFYDKSTTSIGLISDGFFHALSWLTTVGGLFLVADLRRWSSWNWKKWLGGVLLGAGVFQIYDGIIQHKLMMLHQIRYNVVILPYDLTWNLTAIAMIVIGYYLVKKSKYAQKQLEVSGSKS